MLADRAIDHPTQRFRIPLAAMVRRAHPSRKAPIKLAPIVSTKINADALAAIYVRVLRMWAEQVQSAILPAYGRALAQRAPRDGFLADDVGEVQQSVEAAQATMQRLLVTLTPELRRWVVQVEKWHRGKFIGSVLTPTGVDLSVMIGPEGAQETVGAVLARNIALIKDVGAQAQGRISDIVFRGFQARTPIAEVARDLNEAVQLGRDRSLRIAADQNVKLSSELDQERRREIGLDSWIWRHSGKLHPRPEHLERDGNEYTDETAPDDLPGELPGCGCRAQAVLRLD